MSDPAPDPRSLRLNAALDGELDAANALALEQDLAADPALAAEYRALQAVREAVRRHVPREAAPKALVDSVLALADAAEPPGLSNVVPLAPRPLFGARRKGSRSPLPSPCSALPRARR